MATIGSGTRSEVVVWAAFCRVACLFGNMRWVCLFPRPNDGPTFSSSLYSWWVGFRFVIQPNESESLTGRLMNLNIFRNLKRYINCYIS